MEVGKRDPTLIVRNRHPLQPQVQLTSTPRSTSNLPHQDRAVRMMHKGTPTALRPRPRPRPSGAVARRDDDWKTWAELRLKVVNLSTNISTQELWAFFKRHGTVTQIEIIEDNRGARVGTAARVTFRPPPQWPFWAVEQFFVNLRRGNRIDRIAVKLYLEQPRRTFFHPSPVSPLVKYPESMTLLADSLDFGFMSNPETMMTMYTVQSGEGAGIRFKLNLLHREAVVEFRVTINTQWELFRLTVPFTNLKTIDQVDDDKGDRVELVVSLPIPPRFFRKLDEEDTHEEKGRYWCENDAWYRQTDITNDPEGLKTSPVALKKRDPVIDLGRWTTYRLGFRLSPPARQLFLRIGQALRDYNVSIQDRMGFRVTSNREPPVWQYIDRAVLASTTLGSTLEDLLKEESVPLLAFAVRYQLEVCISHGYLNAHNLSRDFIDKLADMEATKAQDLLEYVANQGKRIFEPMELFGLKIIRGLASRPPIPQYCAYIRSATVTPTTIYFNTPTVEISNRVIRYYNEHADRFLRVRFTDEKVEGKIFSTDKNTMDEIFTRVKRTLTNGITIGDRHYEFLAFGNSQFRENGAYFFAPLRHVLPRHMRNWMGNFGEIPYVAQYAARLGQCFSTTRAIIGTKTTIQEIEDEERNGYVFTDGVGKISPFLAQLISHELGIIRRSTDVPPSIFQFRMGGCKGILAVCLDSKAQEITIRRSQYKFAARSEGLEIIRCSQFAASNLNRQIIVVLSTLGVPDGVFIEKQKAQLANLGLAMTNERLALTMLQKDIDPNQMTLALAGMILDGFQRTEEPFMKSLLRLWQAWSIKYLKEKARITIHDGAFLLGCVDETCTLRGHFDSNSPANNLDEKIDQLPEVFVQISGSNARKPHIVTGPMILARNPSLHPGDIRVVKGVDVPELRHLKDVVVVPQTGDRPIVNMCSGGDLDGDDYLIIWDPELLPKEWNHSPMDFTPAQKVPLGRDVTPDDLTTFFVRYMKNDNLSRIAVAHLAYADYMEDGVKSNKCRRLAELHSTAVDYIKSGVPAKMTRDLNPARWPHFMEKENKPEYHSKKVLGQLFDQVERVDFVPVFDSPFDERVLRAYHIDSKILDDAAVLKRQYDTATRRIMAQHAIKTEFEVWSTFVMHHSKASNDYKFHEEIGRISLALKDRFREECYKAAGSKDFETLGPFVAAMYTVTADEVSQAVREMKETGADIMADKMPLMSFPWLFKEVLGRIANDVLV